MKDLPEEVVVRHAVEEDHPTDEEGTISWGQLL